jgi:hypothetical protein
VIELPSFRTSRFEPNAIGPFADALLDVTHLGYRVAYSTLAGIFATDIKG